jgi:hypothetical protein
VSDLHLRILSLMARTTQRELEDHDAVDHVGDTASPGRRQDLVRVAMSTRRRVADAKARRSARRPREAS